MGHWGTTGGFGNYELEIRESRWETRQEFGGNLCLIWEGYREKEDGTREEKTAIFSAGPAWKTTDGKIAFRDDGVEDFHKSSAVGEIIDWVLTGTYSNTDIEADTEGLKKLLMERGDQSNAEVWEGLRLQIGSVMRESFGEKKERERPVAFLGTAETADSAGSKSATSSPSKTKKKKAAADDNSHAEVDMDKLRAIFDDADEFDEYADKAASELGVNDPKLLTEKWDQWVEEME